MNRFRRTLRRKCLKHGEEQYRKYEFMFDKTIEELFKGINSYKNLADIILDDFVGNEDVLEDFWKLYISRVNVIVHEFVKKDGGPPAKKKKSNADVHGNRSFEGKNKVYRKKKKESCTPHPNTLSK